MKSSERFEFHFKPKSFIICPVLTLYLLFLSLSPTNWSCCDSINNHFVYLPGHKVRPDQTRVKNWKGFTFFPLPDTASPFPVLEYLLWGSLYEPATKSFARIFVGPIIRSFVSDTAREKKRCVWQMIVAQNTKQCWGCEVRQKKKRWTVKRVPHRLIWSLVTDDEKDAT